MRNPAQIGFLEGCYLTFPGFLIMPSGPGPPPTATAPAGKRKIGGLLEEGKFWLRTTIVEVVKAWLRGELPPM
jgi:hypothetical protein